jgi:hypothetical protein
MTDDVFTEDFTKTFDKVSEKYDNAMILGDLNYNYLKIHLWYIALKLERYNVMTITQSTIKVSYILASLLHGDHPSNQHIQVAKFHQQKFGYGKFYR